MLVLGSLIAIGPLTIDMYLPALPAITDDLQTTAAAVQLTLTGTLAGLALGQLLIGPLSDAVGRRTPLLAGIAVHVLASLLCVVAPNIARARRAAGAAGPRRRRRRGGRDGRRPRPVHRLAAAKLLSRLMLVMGAAPILAPTLGGERAALDRLARRVRGRWPSSASLLVVVAALGAAARRCRPSGGAAAASPARCATTARCCATAPTSG